MYSLEVKAGDTVTLGQNGQSSGCVNYIVAATTKQPEPSAVLGDVFYPYVNEENGKYVVDLRDAEGVSYAVIEFITDLAQEGATMIDLGKKLTDSRKKASAVFSLQIPLYFIDIYYIDVSAADFVSLF